MTKVETIGVDGGGGDAEGLNSGTRGGARLEISTRYVRAAGATFEGRA